MERIEQFTQKDINESLANLDDVLTNVKTVGFTRANLYDAAIVFDDLTRRLLSFFNAGWLDVLYTEKGEVSE